MLHTSDYRFLLLIYVLFLSYINGVPNSTSPTALYQLDNTSPPVAIEASLQEVAPDEFMKLIDEQSRSKLLDYKQVREAAEGLVATDPEVEILIGELERDQDYWLDVLPSVQWLNSDANNFRLNMRVMRDQNEQITLTFEVRLTQEATVSNIIIPSDSLLFLTDGVGDQIQPNIAMFSQNSNELVIVIPVSLNDKPVGLMVKLTQNEEGELQNLSTLYRDTSGEIQEMPVFTGLVTTSGSNLNVRNGNGDLLPLPGLPNGTTISVLGHAYIDDTWYYNVALAEGQTAYANAQYIQDVTMVSNPYLLKSYTVKNKELAAMLVELAELDALTAYQIGLLSRLSDRAIQFEQPRPDDPVYFDAYGPLSLRVIVRRFLEEINGYILYKAEDVNGKLWIVAFNGAYYRDGRAFTFGSCPLVEGIPEIEGQIVEILAETTGNELPEPTIPVPGSQEIYAVRTECLPEE